ncbi:glycosyltransferase [Mycolicibacterium pyrenivorans]|uniref:glycosyltransferase n=1 Tax=Mycolicibacterium pyrenivorans TaxID=187102 RepID=UPI0021F296B2|nr:glycosyltransferase [Mycolicibacterium pyrenivorans]MCV7152502.1 glycosyltransferase [Mycolicibacterium pyrenivorans]
MPTEQAAMAEPITQVDDDALSWTGAVWVGQLDDREIPAGPLRLSGGERFGTARFLIWTADAPRGFVQVAVRDGLVDGAELAAAAAQLPPVASGPPVAYPPFSVLLCTKDRPDQLRDTLHSLVRLDYPAFEIVVVDNGPESGLTPPVVAEFADQNVRMVPAARKGLAVARNVGIESARNEFIAFTDDDVLVDRRWLKNLARGFSRAADVVCVTGMVPTAEVLTPAQSYFDRRVGWASQCQPVVYDLASPPADDPLFPLRVARFGTGANIAFRRSVVRWLGGFDEGMGVGSPTGGGEDIDMFVRVLLARRTLVYEPGALIWHRHRKSLEELETQIYNYGLGLGAWITKLLLRPRTLGMVVRRGGAGIVHLRSITVVDDPTVAPTDLKGLSRLERRGVLAGPRALLRSRIDGRAATPLRTAPLAATSGAA